MRLRSAAAALLCAVGLMLAPATVQAQKTTVTATNLKMGGIPIPAGTVTITPTNAQNYAVGIASSDFDLNGPQGFTGTIAAGAITGSYVVPDQCLATATAPNTPLYYRVDVYNSAPKSVGNPYGGFTSTYTGVTGVCGSTFALDHYVPTSTASVALTGLATGTAVPTRCSGASIYYKTPAPVQTYNCVGNTYVLNSASGGGVSLPNTSALLKGDGQGGARAADAGTDYATVAQLPATGANTLVITATPYNGSGAGATTATTSAAAASGATSLAVSSCATFLPGNGFRAAGAAINTVLSCVGNTLTASAGLSGAVANGATVQHDETAAFQAAINAIAATATSGTIVVPDGLYLVNGALQDAGGANAMLKVPNLQAYATANFLGINITGLTRPVQAAGVAGAVIQTSATTGNLIGGYYNVGTFAPLTNVYLAIHRITFRAPANTGAVMVNASYIVGLDATQSWCDTGTAFPSIPTSSAGACILAPLLGNSAYVHLDDVKSAGFSTGFQWSEHAVIGRLYVDHANRAFACNVSSYPADDTKNTAHADYLWAQQSNYFLSNTGTSDCPLVVDSADMEDTRIAGVDDPNSHLVGSMSYTVPMNAVSGPQTITNPIVNGGSKLALVNITHPGITINSGTGQNTNGGSGANIDFRNDALGYTGGIGNPTPGVIQINVGANADGGQNIYNSSVGSSASSFLRLLSAGNPANFLGLYAFGANHLTYGMVLPNQIYIGANSGLSNGMVIGTEGAAPVRVGYNNNFVATFQQGLNVGGPDDPGPGVVKAASFTTGQAGSTGGSCTVAGYITLTVDGTSRKLAYCQ